MAGDAVVLALSDAPVGAATTLVAGAGLLGGTLVPVPDVVIPGLTTDGAGALLLEGPLPPVVPPARSSPSSSGSPTRPPRRAWARATSNGLEMVTP